MKDLKGLKIHCDNDEEKRELLEEATKQGFVWGSSVYKPLETYNVFARNDFRFDKKLNLYFNADCCISYKEYKAMSEFTKADLKPCMVVEIWNRNSTFLAMIYINSINELCISCSQFWCQLKEFSDDMVYKEAIIKKVYGLCSYNADACNVSTKDRKLLFERKEEPQAVKETELIWQNVARVIQVQKNGFKKCVYEVPFENNKKETCETVLKNYLNIHHDKNSYFVTTDRIYKVKE